MSTIFRLGDYLPLEQLVWIEPMLAAARRRSSRHAASSGLSTESLVILIAIGLTALVAVGTYYLVRVRGQSASNNPRALFRELCRAHQLSGSQSNLVARLAQGLKLTHPGVLFLDSTAWQIPEDSRDAKSLSKKDWDKLLAIQRMLFMPACAKPQ